MAVGRPRIGVTMDVGGVPDEGRVVMELPGDYAKAVMKAGGLPVLLPWTHDAGLRGEMMEMIDGLLVPGGNDLDPKLYGQERHAKTKVTGEERVVFDLAMLSLAEQRKMPTLGICLGCQMMNVHRRGTLHQHLADVTGAELQHTRPGDRSNAHEVTVRGGTKLAEALGLAKLEANSRHHQGIAKVGQGLVATASAPDGVVEGIEDPTLPFWVAVQWHPENLSGTVHAKLFEALVKAAGEYRLRRG